MFGTEKARPSVDYPMDSSPSGGDIGVDSDTAMRGKILV